MSRNLAPTKIWKPGPSSYEYNLDNKDSHLFVDFTGMDYYPHTIYLPPYPTIGQEHTFSLHAYWTARYQVRVTTQRNRFAKTGFSSDTSLWLETPGNTTPLHLVYNEVERILTGTFIINTTLTQSVLTVSPAYPPWTGTIGSYNIKAGDLVHITSGEHAGKRRRVRSCDTYNIYTDPFGVPGSFYGSNNCEVYFSQGLWYPLTYREWTY